MRATEIGSPRRSGSGRNEGGGRDAIPCGTTDDSDQHVSTSAFQLVGSCLRSFCSEVDKGPHRLPLSLAAFGSLAGRYWLIC
jgi:hypothetical protein